MNSHSMTDIPPRCPDCGVEMEEMNLSVGGNLIQFVSDENRDGILGSLGAKQRFDTSTFVCAECGLSRLYADLDD